MMMQNPDDNVFQDILSEYAAPVEEDGFTQSVLESIKAESKRIRRIRSVAIYGACFIGGLIAASQFPALMALIGEIDIALPSIPQTGAIPLSQWSWAGIVLLGFVLWAALDRKASEIF